MPERATRTLPLALVALAALACASLPPRLRECPGPLRSTLQIAGDFTRMERIRVRGGRVDESFALVVQKTGPRLVVLGTNAFGAKAFVVTQVGERVDAKSFLGRALSVPPGNVLRDLHRAYFLTPEQAEGSERTAQSADAVVRVESARCGYEATILRVSEQVQ